MTQGVRPKADRPGAHQLSGVTEDTRRGDPLAHGLLEDDWRGASRATRTKRLSPGEPSLAKGPSEPRKRRREASRETRPSKAVPARVKSTGMQDRAVCSRISSICRSAKSRPVRILARISRTPDRSHHRSALPGRSATVGPDRGVEGASERWSPPGNGGRKPLRIVRTNRLASRRGCPWQGTSHDGVPRRG